MSPVRLSLVVAELTTAKAERLRKAYKVTEGEGEGGIEEAVITRMATIDC